MAKICSFMCGSHVFTDSIHVSSLFQLWSALTLCQHLLQSHIQEGELLYSKSMSSFHQVSSLGKCLENQLKPQHTFYGSNLSGHDLGQGSKYYTSEKDEYIIYSNSISAIFSISSTWAVIIAMFNYCRLALHI